MNTYLHADDTTLPKEWAKGIDWQLTEGWRAVSCRLAHEVDRLNAELATAHSLLGRIAYPRRGTADEFATLQTFANEIQAIYSADTLSRHTSTQGKEGKL